jgi:protein kinase A
VYNRKHKGPIIPPVRFPGDAQCFDIYPEEDATHAEYTEDMREKYDELFKDF